MKISQKQLVMLYEIAVATLPIVGPLAFDREERRKLVEEIVNQQDRKLVEVK